MSFQVVGFQSSAYRINTDLYEGPLDLLLDLIEHAELDITRLALAQVTDQFLAYLNNIQDRDAAEVSAFLVMATHLLQIKSAALLPRPSISAVMNEQEEDIGEALVRQLIQYKRFKEIALWLKDRQDKGLRTYLRVVTSTPKVGAKLDMSDVSLGDLVQAARNIFVNGGLLTELSKVVNLPRVTIRDRIHSILEYMQRGETTHFQNILKGCSRLEVVISFLALLELIKRRVIEAQQDSVFGEIDLQILGEWNEVNEADLEFRDW